MAYATVQDIQDRMTETMDSEKEAVCTALLDDAAVMIDAIAGSAPENAKRLVSCRMVIRAIADEDAIAGIPIGANQGTVSALGYSQTWSVGSGGTGELYLSKLEKQLLKAGNSIGSYSPVEQLVADQEERS